MSRGQFIPRNHSEVVVDRCRNKRDTGKVIIIDVDEGETDYVRVDIPESSYQETTAERPSEKPSCGFVISIDDENSSDGCEQDRNADTDISSCNEDDCLLFMEKEKPPCNHSKNDGFSSKGRGSQNIYRVHTGFTSKRSTREIFESEKTVNHTHMYESDSSDCEIMDVSSGNIREEWEKAASKRKFHDISQMSDGHASLSGSDGDSRSPYNDFASKGDNFSNNKCSSFFQQNISENDAVHPSQSSRRGRLHEDPEISDSFLRKNSFTAPPFSIDAEEMCTTMPSTNFFSVDDPEVSPVLGASNGQSGDHTCYPYFEASLRNLKAHGEDSFYAEKNLWNIRMENPSPCSKQSEIVSIHGSPGLSHMEEKLPSKSVNGNKKHPEPNHDNVSFQPRYSQTYTATSVDTSCRYWQVSPEAVNSSSTFESKWPSEKVAEKCVPSLGITKAPPDVQDYLIGEREKHKESDEYRRAQEEEWASRQEQLRIQAEEAQRLRRRKRAETMRLLDMEKRQKQRLEEVRESQKKDEEIINLKEQYRAEIRKELDKMELIHRDMASLLRGLGIFVDGGCFPLAHEVNAAYKKALLRFHPDRASRADIRQQVESEEKFKLISRIKEKLLR